MSNAREQILKRLKKNTLPENAEVPLFVSDYNWTHEQRIEQFSQLIQAVHGQVYRVKKENWIAQLNEILAQKNVTQLLISPLTEIAQQVIEHQPDGIQLVQYRQTIEHCKADFFSRISAGLTSTKGAIAETGSLILWPTIEEPRLMSLVPPIHIAVLDVENIYDTFTQAMQAQNWVDNMPTNALLISGPSKTADIEQVLAYGIHGPKQLVIIIRGLD